MPSTRQMIVSCLRSKSLPRTKASSPIRRDEVRTQRRQQGVVDVARRHAELKHRVQPLVVQRLAGDARLGVLGPGDPGPRKRMGEPAVADRVVDHRLHDLEVPVLHGLARHRLPTLLCFVALDRLGGAEDANLRRVLALTAIPKRQPLQLVDVELKVARSIFGDQQVGHQRQEHVQAHARGAQGGRIGAGAGAPGEVFAGGDAEQRRRARVRRRNRL